MHGSADPCILWKNSLYKCFQVQNSFFFVSDSHFPSSVLFIPSSPFPLPLLFIINFNFFSKRTTKWKRRDKGKGKEEINKTEEGKEESERKESENLERKRKRNEKRNKFDN